MSPAKLLSERSFTLIPIEKSPKEKHNFGAVITGLNLNDISGMKFTHQIIYIGTSALILGHKMRMSMVSAMQSGHTKLSLSKVNKIYLPSSNGSLSQDSTPKHPWCILMAT